MGLGCGKNAKTLERDRRSYPSKTVLWPKRASAFNIDDELKNVILVVFRKRCFAATFRMMW
jgi:hypothetical protein